MKKAAFFLFIFLLANVLFCYQLTLVSELESIYVAQNWITFINKIPLEGKQGIYQIKFIEKVYHENDLLCEIYHLNPRGHILVPCYKEFPPIKSFSVVSDFDSQSKGYEYAVLGELKAAFKFLESYSQGESEEVDLNLGINSKQWNRFVFIELERTSLKEPDFLSGPVDVEYKKFILKDHSGVVLEAVTASPLLKTEWGQGSPYWNMCPELNGERCVVGCVATAMAQIMRYYKWPDKGKGSYSYYWDKGSRTLSANFGDSYDWDYMPNLTEQCDTNREKNAVAELCYEAGISIDMSYSPEASGAFTSDVANALKKYFKYSNAAKVVYRYNYANVDKWFNVFKKQRDLSKPVQFRIYGPDVGHSVVVDGYLITNGLKQIHINMGWKGSYDAYYTLDNIVAYYDFTYTFWQYAVIDIVPLYQETYTLTITAGEGGTTDPLPGTYTYYEGEDVTIRAIPGSHYRFSHWGGDISSTDNPVTITMNSNKSIEANFIHQCILTITSGPGGTTNPAPGAHMYDDGTVVSIQAVPHQYHMFEGWSGDASGRENPISITMDTDKSINATFRRVHSPLNFSGQKVLNRSLSQAEYINILTWDANPANDGINIAKYRIYELENEMLTLLKELPSGQFEYWHRKLEKDKAYTYVIICITDEDIEGEPAQITVQ